MQVLRRTLFLAAIATAAVSIRASAQPAPAPSQADTQLARQLAKAGVAAQDAGEYDTAIAYYKKAYQVVPHPLLVFDMAQANRLAGRTAEALVLYAAYLAADPQGLKAQDTRTLIADLQAHAGERDGDPPRPADPASPPGESPLVSAAAPLLDAGPADSGRPDAGPAESSDAPGRNLRWAGLASVAVGAGSLAIGTGFAVHARSLSDEVSKRYDPAKNQAGQRANVIAITGFAAGAGLVAVGAAVYWWGHVRSRAPDQVTLAPMVSDHLAGLAVAGRL